MPTSGARDGATGGGHRASGVTPPRLPVGRAKFVRAHPWVGAAMAKPKAARAGVIEREDIRADQSHLALLTGLDGDPAQARGVYAAAGGLS